MWADLLARYVTPKTAPYLIWSGVLLVCVLYFWLSRTPQKPAASSDGRHSSKSASSARRRVSVCLEGVVCQSATAGNGCELIHDAVAPFLELCATTEVFVMALANDDSSEAAVRSALESVGAFDAGLRPHRVMFSSTNEGRVSMVRQLQPAMHFEALDSVADALAGKVPAVRRIGSSPWPKLADSLNFTDSQQ